jgi:hypothetical protein
MTYTQLQSILLNDEIHYISDSTQFFIDNKIKSKKFKLFEYTIECFPQTLELLNKNNIEYSIYTDDFDLQYIII